jgi:hypothetical protein
MKIFQNKKNKIPLTPFIKGGLKNSQISFPLIKGIKGISQN